MVPLRGMPRNRDALVYKILLNLSGMMTMKSVAAHKAQHLTSKAVSANVMMKVKLSH